MEFWDSLPIFIIYFGIVSFLAISFEIGFQTGKFTRSHYERKSDTSPGPMVAGVLTMLAFVLAFMFSITASRFDNRKQLVVDEANIISTTYLRADLLGQPHSSEAKKLLREYVDIRLKAIEEKDIKTGIEKSLEITNLLWTTASNAAKNEPSILTSLMLQSVNQIMDIHEKRVNAALHDRIPNSIWITLMIIIALSMVTLGSQTGLVKTRRLIQVIPMVFAFSALIAVVVDLDRPAQLGLIGVSQDAMLDLQKRLD